MFANSGCFGTTISWSAARMPPLAAAIHMSRKEPPQESTQMIPDREAAMAQRMKTE
jgi:hypothetical protein